jgi:thiamine pyrophosphokinase
LSKWQALGILLFMNTSLPTPILDEKTRPLIMVGNGAYDSAMLAKFAHLGRVVAVDGGYYGCRLAGITPDLLIGDMDSVDPVDLIDARKKTQVHPISEQDTTDLEKALRHVRAPAILGFGFLGKRFDHSLASLSVLARFTKMQRVMLVGSEDILHVTSGCFRMRLDAGRRLSVWPLEKIEFESSSGLSWTLDGLQMAPNGRVGTSNKMASDRLEIHPKEGSEAAYAVLAETQYLEAMLDALLTQSL